MRKLCQLLLFTLIVLFSEEAILSSIPRHLQQCYQNGGPLLGAPKRLDVFLSLIRRLERETSLDVRLFSASLLRSLRLDGIEEAGNSVETDYLLPYRASAFQYNRYKLLMNIFLPSQDLIDIDEILTIEEKCLLHTMLSSTVQRWERGDESTVCPLSIEQRQTVMAQSMNRLNSRCPIEHGVIQTDWGPIAPGTVVAAIAASLEAQRVSIIDVLNTNEFREEVSQALLDNALQEWDDKIETLDENANMLESNSDVNNIWVATLAGDLAEVVVNQGPRVGAKRLSVGSSNRWNDTLLPRHHYMFPQNETVTDWQITDAEILAGIDGLILAHHVPNWVEQRRSLRLSQIIEMYYSNEGPTFDQKVSAWNRQALFSSLINSNDLLEETFKFSNLLSLHQITVYVPREEMRRLSEAAATAFMNYVPSVLRMYHSDYKLTSGVTTADFIVATDGSWKNYQVEQFMSWLGGAVEVDAGRSTLALLHGNTGQWLVPPASNLTAFFTTLNNATIEWPNRLNLPNVVSRIITHSRNQTVSEIEDMSSAGHSTVVLIVSPTDRPSSVELERARQLMASLRTSFFDVYFTYIAQDLTDFQNVNNEYLDYSEIFLQVPSISIADVMNAVETHVVNTKIPSRIFSPQCPVNGSTFEQRQYEDYVLPGREQAYRIHPFYLRQTPVVNVQFRNDGHGRLLVCTWRGADMTHRCQAIAERESYIFNITNPCPSPEFCPPANFLVTATTTSNICAHKDCRLPHQVGYYIQHSGLRCLPLMGSAANVSPVLKVHLILSLIISLVKL
ncbi:uncharacterized protein LOC121730463 [Aricia agestis]|uniref:uncharacterized protein LOC121730463 n=1 Tax=Aricia agestis TaxID=91739 RepID=UPI001C20BEB1|nr:uncharacterized protein LOC121730463 [Aricia agestis]